MVIDQRTQDRLPPHDLQAEQSVLGAMMIDNHYIDNVCGIVSRGDFYEQRNQMVLDAIVALSEQSIAVDIITVTDELVKRDNLEKIGGRAYLVELQEDVYSAANCERYAQIVKEKATLRRLMRTSAEIFHSAQHNEDTRAIIARADSALFEIAAGNGVHEMRSQSDIARGLIQYIDETIEARSNAEVRRRWLRTGLTELDNLLFKLDPGLMTIIAARPGDGKTVLGLQICDWLDRCGVATGFVSLEMPEEQLLLRLISNKTEIPMWAIRKAELNDAELARVYQAVAEYGAGSCKLHLTHIRGGRTPFEVRRRLRYLKREYDIKLAVVDYVQQMSAPGRRWEKRVDELTHISSALTETAAELQIHLIVVSQMSRPDKGKPEREPQLEDLRDCGSLEQDATSVMFIHHGYRHQHNKSEYPDGYPDIILRKQRNGPTGRARFRFNGTMVRFEGVLQEQLSVPEY